jgi:Xaa-Pro aminopeptidase
MDMPREDFVFRLAQIRQRMAGTGLDALLIYSWKRGQVRYVSAYAPNYVANTAMVLVPRQGDPTLFIRFPFDLERARAMSPFEDVRASGDVAAMGRDAAARLRELRLDRVSIGLVSGDGIIDELPHTLYQQLRDELPAAAFCDARELIMDLRLIKSPAESALLEGSAGVADAAVAAAGEALAPGVSEYAVVAAAEAAARAAGAEGFLIAIASQAARELVGPPEDKVVELGDMVILEAAVQVRGYWAQVARAFVQGEPTAEQQAIYKAVHRAYLSAIDAACPGKALGEVARAAHTTLDAEGYGDFVQHDLGHGIGLDLPEPPRIELGIEAPVEAGMALVIHPAVRVPDVGGAFLGGTVLVTPHGAVPVHRIPESLP